MEKTTLLTNLRQVLADDSNVMADSELLQIVNLAIFEYSRMRPVIANTTVNTTTGTTTYALDGNVLGIYAVLNGTATTAFQQSGQSVIFNTDPGTSTYTVRAAMVHVESPAGTYATIPTYDLPLILDIATYIMLERIADDIVRRPDITDGQTQESWRNSAEVLYQRANALRFRVSANAGDDLVFIA
jgi:hypothetical protein